MIDNVLTRFSRQMEQYLHHFFHQPEGLVEIAPIGEQGAEEPCKLVISMLNMERETVQSTSIHLNIYILIAAVLTVTVTRKRCPCFHNRWPFCKARLLLFWTTAILIPSNS